MRFRLAVAIVVSLVLIQEFADAEELFATTNLGELVRIDLDAGTVTEIGEQAIRWADVARDPLTGDLGGCGRPFSSGALSTR